MTRSKSGGVSGGDAAESAPAAQRTMTWDERRVLALDIANLAPPDLPGVLFLLKSSQRGTLQCQEYPPDAISAWDAYADTVHAERLPSVETHPIQMDCLFDLDTADPALLLQLREYVDGCFIPHYVPKENCMICEGLWSNGHVIACGKDACDVRIHDECFGIVMRQQEDGPWLCPSCLFGRQLTCAVCMQSGGALKPLTSSSASKDATDEIKWVHVLCAMAIPELTMRDVPTMEPVDGFDEIENSRFRYLCGICRKRGGASVICEQENCNVGMHPLCAANAGFMIGNESKPLGVYCEKHLPLTRVAGAKRWISDEDLVEEIMSENSVDEDEERLLARNDPMNLARHAFILESTAALFEATKLLGSASALRWGPLPRIATRGDTKLSVYGNVKINPSAWSSPGTVVVGSKTRRPIVFPPKDHDRIGLPVFPRGDDLVGAVVDFLMKDQDEWVRARVVEWEPGREMHLVQLIGNAQKLWAKLSTSNALVLYLDGQESEVDGPRITLYRPIRRGVAEWRPKPRQFAAST